MKKTMVTIFLMLLIGVTACEKNPKKPGFEIKMLSDMKRSVAYEAYATNPVLKNNMTMQAPVNGTIHRGQRVTVPMNNPIPNSKKVMARGQELYEIYCLVCHGKTGDGDGPLIPKYPNPPALTAKKLVQMTAGDIYTIIVNGKDDMPSHAGQIQEDDRWKLIHYIQKLQGKVE